MFASVLYTLYSVCACVCLCADLGERFRREPRVQESYRVGDRVELECAPPPSHPESSLRVRWLKDEAEVLPQYSAVVGGPRLEGNHLVFDAIRKSDAATYTCRAANSQANAHVDSKPVRVQVFGTRAYEYSLSNRLCSCSLFTSCSRWFLSYDTSRRLYEYTACVCSNTACG